MRITMEIKRRFFEPAHVKRRFELAHFPGLRSEAQFATHLGLSVASLGGEMLRHTSVPIHTSPALIVKHARMSSL